MRLANTVVLASLNREKFEEFQAIFAAYPEVTLVPVEGYVRNAENLRFAERHNTYLENAIAKARLVNLGSHYPTLSDDSGLEVVALGNKPGVRSHRYATPKAQMSQDQANVELLLSEMKSVSDRTARFVCTLALLIEGILIQATGTLEGVITEAPRGTEGFGYDPIFVPKGSNKTLAEMTAAEKNAISHRAKAVHELMAEVKGRGITFAKP